MNDTVTLRLLGRDRRITGGPFGNWSGEGIGLCLDPANPKRGEATLALDLADFAAPTQAQLHDTLAALLAGMRDAPDTPVYIGCKAGLGRTGTFIAALAKLAGHDDPVAWTRRHYRAEAVETEAQAEAVAALDPGQVWAAWRAHRHHARTRGAVWS